MIFLHQTTQHLMHQPELCYNIVFNHSLTHVSLLFKIMNTQLSSVVRFAHKMVLAAEWSIIFCTLKAYKY